MKVFYLFILLCVSQIINAQVQLLDKDSHQPIIYATVMSNGKVICYSDSAGYIKLPCNKDADITIQHIAYQTYEGRANSLQKDILLVPMGYSLNDIDIKAIKPDYIKLKGYFRSYELNDSVLKYYTDGIVEYYIPMHKGKVRHRLLSYRFFRNEELMKPSKLVTVIDISDPELPTIEDKLFSSGKYHLSNDGRILKGNAVAGVIETDSVRKINLLSVNWLAPQQERSFSLFGHSVRFLKDIHTQYSQMSDGPFSWSNFISQGDYSEFIKKDGKSPSILDETDSEFFVQEHKYVTKEELKGIELDKNNKIPHSHSYTSEYWTSPTIPQNSAYMGNMLVKVLKIY
jgi:hypothetical protein